VPQRFLPYATPAVPTSQRVRLGRASSPHLNPATRAAPSGCAPKSLTVDLQYREVGHPFESQPTSAPLAGADSRTAVPGLSAACGIIPRPCRSGLRGMAGLAVDSAEAGRLKHVLVVCEKYHKLANLRLLPIPRVPPFNDASWSRFMPRVAIAGRPWILRGFRTGHRVVRVLRRADVGWSECVLLGSSLSRTH